MGRDSRKRYRDDRDHSRSDSDDEKRSKRRRSPSPRSDSDDDRRSKHRSSRSSRDSSSSRSSHSDRHTSRSSRSSKHSRSRERDSGDSKRDSSSRSSTSSSTSSTSSSSSATTTSTPSLQSTTNASSGSTSASAANAADSTPSAPVVVSSSLAEKPANITGLLSRLANLKQGLQKQLGSDALPSSTASSTTSSTTTTTSSVASNLAALDTAPRLAISPMAMEAMKRAQMLVGVKTKAAPRTLLVDSEGREIDEEGNLVTKTAVSSSIASTALPSTTMINRRLQEEEAAKSKAATSASASASASLNASDEVPSQFIDSRMRMPATERKKRTFNFYEEGTFVRKANRIRAQEKLDEWAKDGDKRDFGLIALEALPSFSSDAASSYQVLSVAMESLKEENIPAVEWWDTPFLHAPPTSTSSTSSSSTAAAAAAAAAAVSSSAAVPTSYPSGDLNGQIKTDQITHYILHPAFSQAVHNPAIKQKVYLTKQEAKKLRRMNRLETVRLKQERVMLGLEEDEDNAKATMKNFMRVKGDEAIQDPTLVETMVKKKMAEKRESRNKMNEDRKLTKEQRAEKKLKKLRENADGVCHVCVFKVHSLANPLWRRKIDSTAQSLLLTGCVLYLPTTVSQACQLVLVEGPPKAVKKFKKLMQRMDWTEQPLALKDDDDTTLFDNNKCFLVWEGTTLRPSHKKFRFQQCLNRNEAREAMAKKGVEHYWNLVVNFVEPV